MRRGLPVGVASAAWWSVVAAQSAVYVYLAVTRPGGPDGMSDLQVYLGAVHTLLAGGGTIGKVILVAPAGATGDGE